MCKIKFLTGVSLLNFFDLKPLNTSKQALNTNPPFFGTPCRTHNQLLSEEENEILYRKETGVTEKCRRQIIKSIQTTGGLGDV